MDSTRIERENYFQRQFSTIDIDVTLQILDLIHVKDILSVRQCSKHFNAVSRLRTVWHNAFIRHILEQDIPLPRTLDPLIHHHAHSVDDLSDLSSEALETIVLVALRSRANWRKPIPKRSLTSYARSHLGRVFYLNFIDLKVPPDHTRRDNLSDFAHNTEGRYILSAGYSEDNVLRLDVWDVESSHGDSRMRLVGEWTESGRLFGLAIDHGCEISTLAPAEQAERGALIAFSVRTSSGLDYAYTLRILRFSPPSHSDDTSAGGLTLNKSIPVATSARVESLCDRRLAIRMNVDHNIGVLKVIDWLACSSIPGDFEDQPTIIELTASQYGIDRTVLEVYFIHDWVFVFRESVLEFYFLPPWFISARAAAAASRPNSLQPVCLHKWAWNLNSLSVSHRVSWIHDRKASNCATCANRGTVPLDGIANRNYTLVCKCRYRPLSIAIRFDSYFPWPVNLMHHYVLPTQMFYDAVSLAKQLLAERDAADALESNPSFEVKDVLSPAHISPYVLPPLLEHTIPSAVRLFARSDLFMCRYGSLIWLDSEADYSPQSSISLRLSDSEGHHLTSQPSQPTSHVNEDVTVYLNSGSSGGVYADGTGERIAGRHLDIAGSISALENDTTHMETAVSQALENTIGQSYGGSRTVTTLFGTRQWEGWYSIAANERAGRIVVGDKEGGIEVWDYF